MDTIRTRAIDSNTCSSNPQRPPTLFCCSEANYYAVHHYNHEWPSSGLQMEGRTPIQMFLEGIVEQPDPDLAEAH